MDYSKGGWFVVKTWRREPYRLWGEWTFRLSSSSLPSPTYLFPLKAVITTAISESKTYCQSNKEIDFIEMYKSILKALNKTKVK
jgi:hypothetical protein